MALYHKDVFLPAPARALRFAVLLKYSAHARMAAMSDRYGQIELPRVFNSDNAELVEAEVEKGKVQKMVYRQPYNEENDLVIVLNPDGFVRTVWLNQSDDSHRTLDTEKYATA